MHTNHCHCDSCGSRCCWYYDTACRVCATNNCRKNCVGISNFLAPNKIWKFLTTLSPHPKIRTGTPQNQKHRSSRFISTYKYRCLWYGLGSYSPELVNFSYVRSFPFPPNRTTRGLHEKINFERSSKPKPKHKNRVGISLSQSPYQTNNNNIDTFKLSNRQRGESWLSTTSYHVDQVERRSDDETNRGNKQRHQNKYTVL